MSKVRRHTPPDPSREKPSGQTVFLWFAVAVSGIGLIALAIVVFGGKLLAADETLRLENIPFNGARAYDYLKEICKIGPRRSGSNAMLAQQDFVEAHFKKLGVKVERRKFKAPYPSDGPDKEMIGHDVPMVNMVVRFGPEDSKERILLCGHYDTLPFPLQDPVDRLGRFVGANDNGAGVAIFMELGNVLAKNPPKIGIDFVFFDGEEFLFNRNGKYFFGSEEFANDYVKHPPSFKYRYAVLLDMVAGTDLRLPQEAYSASWDDAKPLVKQIWDTAARLRVQEFLPWVGSEALDDHIALHNVAKIPACDLIDFSYPYWHTQQDTPEHCSPLSMAKVGWVLQEWLKAQ
jgi:glutaminyl-peptide cyclotransferase